MSFSLISLLKPSACFGHKSCDGITGRLTRENNLCFVCGKCVGTISTKNAKTSSNAQGDH